VIGTVRLGTGISTGISFQSTYGSFAVNNRISWADVGIFFNGSSFGKYRDNLTVGVTTNFTGGTDAGNNN
jgi:hypothetical protein